MNDIFEVATTVITGAGLIGFVAFLFALVDMALEKYRAYHNRAVECLLCTNMVQLPVRICDECVGPRRG